MPASILFLLTSIILIMITTSSDCYTSLPNPLQVQLITKLGSFNLFLTVFSMICIAERFVDIFINNIDSIISKNILSLNTSIVSFLGIVFGIGVNHFSESLIFQKLPLVEGFGMLSMFASLAVILFAFKKSPLGLKFLLAVFFICTSGYSAFYIFQNSSIYLSLFNFKVNKIIYYVFASTWPNKPFAFKNIFNELSGDNALNRELLSQKPKASTQCKC